MTTISVESLLRNTERLFLPSPCLLVSHKAGTTRRFDRNAPDAERVLRDVLTAHLGSNSPDVEIWVDWCMDDSLPRHSDTKTAKDRGQKIFNWGRCLMPLEASTENPNRACPFCNTCSVAIGFRSNFARQRQP